MTRRLAATIGLLAGLAPAWAYAQTNIDQGKTPAQIFASACAECHKATRALASGKNSATLTDFLQEHYTTSRGQAAALAAYVLSAAAARAARLNAGKSRRGPMPRHPPRSPSRQNAKPGSLDSPKRGHRRPLSYTNGARQRPRETIARSLTLHRPRSRLRLPMCLLRSWLSRPPRLSHRARKQVRLQRPRLRRRMPHRAAAKRCRATIFQTEEEQTSRSGLIGGRRTLGRFGTFASVQRFGGLRLEECFRCNHCGFLGRRLFA